MNKLTVTSPAFAEGGWIPLENSARGRDVSPQLDLHGLTEGARSIAVTLDDASHPLFPNYNHWLIWNIPASPRLPPAIPHGETVPSLSGARQGIAYGRHRYKGPKPPLKAVHRYTFTVYALDGMLSLPPGSRRRDFLRAAEGHILQTGTLTGQFRSRGAAGR